MHALPYSGLFLWVKIFREKLEEALRVKFCGFKFRGAILYFGSHKRNMKYELGSCMRCEFWF